MEKATLRKHIRELKRSYSPELLRQKSQAIMRKLKELNEYKNAERIACYWSMSDEVHTHDFVMEASVNKKIYLPVIAGSNLVLRLFTGIDNMVTPEGNFSIPEPNEHSQIADISEIDLLIIPGVAFSLKGERMGRGKGFYDRLLKNVAGVKLGVCFDFQLVEYIPTNEHDVLMDKVIYE